MSNEAFGLADPSGSRAILIGVHSYALLEQLPAVERNLDGLSDALTDPALWGLPAENCVVVSQPADGRIVLDRVWEVALQATDCLIIYYSGHGLVDLQHDEELYLSLPHSDLERMYNSLRYEDLRRVVLDHQVRASRKIIILDCCYGARAMRGAMSPKMRLEHRAAIEGTCLLAAASEFAIALAPPGEKFTAFTGELIDLLTNGVDGGPSLLDMGTLYRVLQDRLRAKSRPVPQVGYRNFGDRIALVRNRAYRTVASTKMPDVEPPPPASTQLVPTETFLAGLYSHHHLVSDKESSLLHREELDYPIVPSVPKLVERGEGRARRPTGAAAFSAIPAGAPPRWPVQRDYRPHMPLMASVVGVILAPSVIDTLIPQTRLDFGYASIFLSILAFALLARVSFRLLVGPQTTRRVDLVASVLVMLLHSMYFLLMLAGRYSTPDRFIPAIDQQANSTWWAPVIPGVAFSALALLTVFLGTMREVGGKGASLSSGEAALGSRSKPPPQSRQPVTEPRSLAPKPGAKPVNPKKRGARAKRPTG